MENKEVVCLRCGLDLIPAEVMPFWTHLDVMDHEANPINKKLLGKNKEVAKRKAMIYGAPRIRKPVSDVRGNGQRQGQIRADAMSQRRMRKGRDTE